MGKVVATGAITVYHYQSQLFLNSADTVFNGLKGTKLTSRQKSFKLIPTSRLCLYLELCAILSH